MRKKFTMLLASLFLCIGATFAENVLFNAGSTAALPGQLTDGQYYWTSSEITAPADFKTLRLTFTKNVNGALSYGYPHVAIAEFYLYDKDGDAVALTEANFTSNATETQEGSVAELCDGSTTKQDGEGDYDWYWHSFWSQNVNAYHYLEINVSEIAADLSTFTIGYVTRQSNGSPAEIVVTTGGSTEDVAQQCPNVTITYNHKLGGENKMTEQLPAVVGASFPTPSLPWGAKTETELPTAVTTDAIIDLEVTYSNELPFVPSVDFENAAWYYLHLHTNKQYIRYNADDTSIPMGITSPDPTDLHAYAWAFIGSPYEGYKLVNRKAGSDRILSAPKNVYDGNTGGNTYPLVKLESEIDEASANKSWIIAKSNDIENGMYIGLTSSQNSTVNMNDRGKLAFWTGGQGAGSTFTVTEFSYEPALAIAKDNAVKNLTTLAATSAICTSDAAESAKTQVEAISLSENTETAYNDALAELNACMSSLVEGKYFTINSVADNSKYLTTNDGKAISTNTVDIKSYWTLKSVAGLFYLYNRYNNAYLQAVPSTNETIINATNDINLAAAYQAILPTETDNVWALTSFVGAGVSEVKFVHKAGDGRIVRWDAATSTTASHWTIASVDYAAAFTALIDAQLEGKVFSETPALGEYPTYAKEEFETLKAAYLADPTEENEVALVECSEALTASINVPVYFITGNTYATGSAIYYDGANWKWKTANKFDRQMWMTIPGYTEENVPVVDAYDAAGISYEICDYLTGTVMRDKSVQIVKIDGWTDAYNLQYSTTTNDAVMHAQEAVWGANIVGWNPATTTDCLASAWGVDFMGTSYELSQLTDAQLETLNNLQTAFNDKKYLLDYDYDGAPGSYVYDAELMEKIVTAGQILEQRLSTIVENAATVFTQCETLTAELDAAELQLCLPEAGKFYRIKNNGGTGYLSGDAATSGRVQFVADIEESASSVFYFTGTQLLSYSTGLYLAKGSSENFVHYTQTVGEDAGTTFVFKSSPVAGKLLIEFMSSRSFYSGGVGASDAAGSGQTGDNYRFTVEEVTTLPVAVSAAGYATLYAPVALTIPADVTVYTATVNGEYLTLNEVEGAIPANTGVLIEAAEDTYDFTVATEAAAIEGSNAFTGALAKSAKNAAAKVYTLQKPGETVGFYLFKGYTDEADQENTKTYINGFRAWVELPLDATVQGLRITRGDDAEDTTGIESTVNGQQTTVIYDLAGRRVEKMEKGIYIVNGRKVVVK